MTAAEAHLIEAWIPRPESHRDWASLAGQAPQLTATMRRYLVQLTTFLAPRSVDAADSTLRQLARWLTANTDVTVVADIGRTHTSRTTRCGSPPNPAASHRRSRRTLSGNDCG
jgi:hypothetical protein